MAAEEEGTGGVLASNEDLIAQYQTTRVRSFWTYKRIFQLTKVAAQTLDPTTFSVTNTFPYENINNILLDPKNAEQFTFDLDKTGFTFKLTHRAHLLCQLYECIARKVPGKLKSSGPFEAERLRKNGTHVDCKIIITYYGIVEMDPYDNVMQEYKWVNFRRLGSDESSNGFFFEHSGRTKIFLSSNIDRIVKVSQTHLQLLGLGETVPVLLKQPLTTIIKYRADIYSSIPAAVAVFDVSKYTRRSARPLSRQLHVSERYLKETDATGFQTVSYHRVDAIYAIVRSWDSLREFKLEFNDGSSRRYSCTLRDTLLATLLDVCHATGNIRVIVTGEVSDGLRLMPRFAEEEYKATVRDAFFGASSIEAWYLSRLVKIFKATHYENEAVIQACRELNANVPCPGISPNTELIVVKAALTGVLGTIQSELVRAFRDERLDNSREIAIMLQSLYRIIPCVHGYKCFVEVKEVDTRQLLLQLLRYDHDFVHYWTLEMLMALCKCPLDPRNTQQEFVNKHTLLTDRMLRHLTDLMCYKSDEETAAESAPLAAGPGESSSTASANAAAEDKAGSMAAAAAEGVSSKGSNKPKVAGNPAPAGHIPTASFQREDDSGDVKKEAAPEVIVGDAVHFTPNALLVIGAASLLESLVCSRRDTSSPELMNQILDLLVERCDVLINMLRSTSFLIMENASIMMFVLQKNRPAVSPLMRELALSECLVIKNFYYAVFSPSVTQRFLSRFLMATWMSGPERTNPAKALLTRMLPLGLTEYLKFAAITEEHRKNLDAMEDEFYSAFANSQSSSVVGVSKTVEGVDLMYQRMRKRIATAVKDKSVIDPNIQVNVHAQLATTSSPGPATGSSSSSSSGGGGGGGGVGGGGGGGGGGMMSSQVSSPMPPSKLDGSSGAVARKTPENFRVMFHMITQDHKLADLIWNEQTRLELRTALESEIKEFDREQRLLGSRKIAWNYQQFSVRYDSLREELQVGPIYIRYFLEAGDAYLRTLENPNHIVLFEKLFRRVLVNIEYQPSLSILCVKCLVRLYEVCADLIGTFDDMLIVVRMLEQASNMELQQYLLDMISILSQDSSNLSQLLDKAFVNTMIKYVTLAHINPDQIGNALARATANVLMIKDSSTAYADSGSSDDAMAAAAAGGGGGVGVGGGGSPRSEEDIAKQARRSMWVPDDAACPKVWFAAPPGKAPPAKQLQKGPYRVSELLDEFESGRIKDDWLLAALSTEESDDDRFDVIVDTGRWKTVGEYFQLRLQMLFPGKAVYSPAQVAAKALKLLQRVASIHRASNSKGIPFYPIPMSKKLMSDPFHLNIFAQLLLSNDPMVVDNAAELIRSLTEFNANANSKLYLTGAFFFAARYTGNNYNAISWLFHVCHLRQSFHDSAASVARDVPIGVKSILGMLFPQAMICMLVNYGPDRFASVHTGVFDTPEVIWNGDLRRQLVEMVDAHLGDYPARLRQHTTAAYEYVPLAKIHYPLLEKEIYVHEYYLKNLCDEVRFPDWPIGQPLVLLRECIQRWRDEMSKGIVDSAVSDAKKVLRLDERFENAQLRRAYKNLAREYHPDKNPQGRDMFEKIQVAYELLSSVEMQETETNMLNVLYLMKTQNILYRRFPESINDQKYPAYGLLVQVIRLPPMGQLVEGVDAEILIAASMLLFYTTSVSPLNAKEFVKAGVLHKLYGLFSYAISLRSLPQAEGLFKELLVYVMKTFTAIVFIDEGRDEIISLCPRFAEDMYSLLGMKKTVPVAVENGIEVISRCCSSPDLQRVFIEGGVIWRLIPLLLEFDATFKGDYSDEQQRMVYNQCASNVLAIVSAKALGRLGGYMFDELKSPDQPDVKAALSTILTQPLASLLRNRRPWELLQSLNENVETTTKIWNVGMRKELLDFMIKVDATRPEGSSKDDLKLGEGFVYSNLREELCVNGVYVRIFNKTNDANDILDPSQFACQLLTLVHRTLTTARGDISNVPGVHRVHLDYAIDALRILTTSLAYIGRDIALHTHGIDTVMMTLDLPSNSEAFSSGAQLLGLLLANPEFVGEFTVKKRESLWRLMKCLSTVDHAHVLPAWQGCEALATHIDGLGLLLQSGSIARILGVLFAVKGYVNSYSSRLAAVSLLSKMLWNQVKGDEASVMLSRFLPKPMVILLKGKAGAASIQLIDTICENPELIWTAEMQNELRQAILTLLGPVVDATVDFTMGFDKVIVISPDYSVNYQQLANEIYLGGVYIRIYLKQPTFRLSNAVFFVEKLIDFWESSFNAQVPLTASTASFMEKAASASASDSTAIILGKEDFLSLLTSCLVCAIKSEPAVIDHLLSWGYLAKLGELLQRAVRNNRRGSPLLCIIRLLHTMIGRVDVVEALSSSNRVDMISLLKDSMLGVDGRQLSKDCAIIAELLKRIFQSQSARNLLQLVASARQCLLPIFLLDNVLGAESSALNEVLNSAALKIHAVDLLKAILAADPENEAGLQALLTAHHAWREYKDQSHDLFLTDKEKTDVYLIQDAADSKFAGLLLTDGSEAKLANMFASTGHRQDTGGIASDSQHSRKSSRFAPPPAPQQPPVAAMPAPPVPVGTATSSASAKAGAAAAMAGKPLSASAVPPSASAAASSAAGSEMVTTTVMKGEHGIGLNVAKSREGRGIITSFKDMPDGSPNPAKQCVPPIKTNDIIASVNGERCDTFNEAVRLIKASAGAVTLGLLRS